MYTYLQKELLKWPNFYYCLENGLENEMRMNFLTLTCTHFQPISILLFKKSTQGLWTVFSLYSNKKYKMTTAVLRFSLQTTFVLRKVTLCSFIILHYLVFAYFYIQAIFFSVYKLERKSSSLKVFSLLQKLSELLVGIYTVFFKENL